MKLILILLTIALFSCGSGSKPLNLKNIKPGNLQFFETYNFSEIYDSWNAACNWAHDHDSISLEGTLPLDEVSKRDLRNIVRVTDEANVFGFAAEEDIPTIDSILAIPEVKKHFPKNLKFMWSFGVEYNQNGHKIYALHAVKIPDGDKAIIDGRHILTAETGISEFTQQPVIRITMNDQGSHDWELMTRGNIGRPIAITLDDHVLSCPIVADAIAGGETEISGNFTKAEAEELAARIYLGRRK